MKKSDSIVELSKALTQAWKGINNPKHNQKVTVRTKKGGQYDFQYTDLTGILDEIKPHLSKNGISVLQNTFTEFAEGHLLVSVTTKLLHESGEWIESKPLSFPVGENDIQTMGGLVTYMKRYSLSAMLGISTEADDDGNVASGNTATFKASNKQLDFIDNLLRKKVSDTHDYKTLYDGLKKRLKTTSDMENWTSSQASQAIKILKGDSK